MHYKEIITNYKLPDNAHIFMSTEIANMLNVNEDDDVIFISEPTTLRPAPTGNPSSYKIFVSDRNVLLNPIRHTFKTDLQPNFEIVRQNTKHIPAIIAVSLDKVTDSYLSMLKPYHAQLFKSREDIIKPLDIIKVNTPLDLKLAKESIEAGYTSIDFDKPANFLAKVIEDNTFIFFYTDSDADGVLSGATCDYAMKAIKYDNYMVKSNDRHYGNGVNEHTITLLEECLLDRNISEDEPIIMVTADHGSSNVKAIKNLRDRFPTLKVIITDHHNFNELNEPDVDFHLNNQASYSNLPKSYSGCVMVGYLMANLIEMLNKPLNKAFFIPLAISMVSDRRDMLCGYARMLVSYVEQGIHNTSINLNDFPAFKNIEYKSNSWGWNLVPILNSGGRQSSSNTSLNFLCCDVDNYSSMYRPLVKINSRRKLVQKDIKNYILNVLCNTVEYTVDFSEKYKAMAYYVIPYSKIVELGFEITEVNGINGILASILDSYKYRPTIVLAEQPDGSYKGSGRKNVHGNFSFRGILKTLSEKGLLQGGGHDGASGVSIKKENLATVLKELDDYALEADPDGYERPSAFDIEIEVKYSGKPFLEFLESFGPYGTNWETPKIKINLDKVDKKITRPKPYLHDTIVFQQGVQCIVRRWGRQPNNYKPTGIGSATWDDRDNTMLVTER